MELSSHQGLHFLRCRGGHICKAIESGIYQATEGILCSIGALGDLRSLPNNKCKSESKFIVVVELDDEIRVLSRGRGFRVLEILSVFTRQHAVCRGRCFSSYLDIFHYSIVSKVPGSRDSRCGECIWNDTQDSSAARIGDQQRRNSYYLGVIISFPLSYPSARYTHTESGLVDRAQRPHRACCSHFPS